MSDKSAKRKSNRVLKACASCRKRKQGCDEERPCKRCLEKGIECCDVESKKRKTKKKQFKKSRKQISDESDDAFEELISEDSFVEDIVTRSRSSSLSELEPSDSEMLEIQVKLRESLNVPSLVPEDDSEENEANDEAESSSDEEDLCCSDCDEEMEEDCCGNEHNLNLILPLLHPRFHTYSYFSDDAKDEPSSPTLQFTDSIFFDFPFYLSSTPDHLEFDENDNDVFLKDDGEVHSSIMMYAAWWNEWIRQHKNTDTIKKELCCAKEKWKDLHKLMKYSEFNVNNLHNFLSQMDVRNFPVGIVCWSGGGKIHHANSTFCDYIGKSIHEILYDPLFDGPSGNAHKIFASEDVYRVMQKQLFSTQQPSKGYFHYKMRLKKNGGEAPVNVLICNLCDTVGSYLITVAYIAPV